jgi:hypothetical protein
MKTNNYDYKNKSSEKEKISSGTTESKDETPS